ncbi:hypothetical protein BGZ54_007272 [Gamsiella multidivaricata]|nr:hypothetical protein BGZ54_007272 [Gamsiella multidivaricata]
MLAACADLSRATASPIDHNHGHHTKQKHSPRKGHQIYESDTNDLGSNLLQTILQSSMFTADEVYRKARFIYEDIATGLYLNAGRSDTVRQPRVLSLPVTNAFLNVCAITGHFDEASSVLNDMMHSAQGGVKPDLATYRYVLRAASAARRQLQRRSADTTELDTRVDELIQRATEALSRQSRVAFWIKMGLGGLVGATVGKFTMLGVMALPYSGSLQGITGPATEAHPVVLDPSLPVDGIVQFLASQEVAMGVGLAAGLLTAGYFIRGSTRHPVAHAVLGSAPGESTGGSRSAVRQQHQRHHHHPQILPRARIAGLYFPDLATTDKKEIRDYLRRSMGS